jgi:hypothetical protein
MRLTFFKACCHKYNCGYSKELQALKYQVQDREKGHKAPVFRGYGMYDGYVFLCNKQTQQECLSTKHYTCMSEHNKPSETIKEGSVIFLYNVETRNLLGPFTALTEGADELDAGAWRMDVDTHIPSEDLKVNWEKLHVIHDADKELPFLLDMKTCKLGVTQTQRALDLLMNGEPYLQEKEASS